MFDDRSVLILSGPGGVGKSTIVAALLARDDRLWLSRSWTTRSRRPGEPADAYRFMDRATFEMAIRAGEFLEWVKFLDYLQGTPIPDPPDGADVLLEIDGGGARQVKKVVPDVMLVFLDVSSVGEQRARMVRRGDSEVAINTRLTKTASERTVAMEMGYKVVVNDDLSRAVADIETLIAADRNRRRTRVARRHHV